MPIADRAQVFLTYLDYFRGRLIEKLEALPERELRSSRLASNWTPVELIHHVRHVERRWLEWGFLGLDVGDPWADNRDDRWYVSPDLSPDELAVGLRAQAARTREIVESHDLTEVGLPGERWEGDEPPTLERILFHLLQEYARHTGHLDIVSELATGSFGE
jgi:uncharacterized damage-inducible protein DinB